MRLLPGTMRRVSLLLLTLALSMSLPISPSLAVPAASVTAESVTADTVSAAASAAPAAASARPTDPIAHDPTIAKQGAYSYVVITGDAQKANTYLPMMRSKDLVHWQQLGPVLNALPSWVTQQLGTTPADAWGPDLQWSHGQWRLYYAASVFGTQNSVIGLATSPTLDPDSPDYKWTDQGMVLRSSTGADDFNAIDPDYVDDGRGGAWLAFGSFWGGIKMFRLDPATGKLSTTDTTEYSLAARVAPDAEEGPSIVEHGGYYYLFASVDYCCRGIDSDYRMVVGRAKSVTGPYVDQSGTPLLDGGGTEVMRGYNEFVGTGGGQAYVNGGISLMVNHYYDATDAGTPRLNVRDISWRGGWPLVGDPLNPSRTVGHGDAYVRLIERSTGQPVADAGCGYEGADLVLGRSDPADTCQQWQLSARAGGGASLLSRYSNKVAEVHACENYDGGSVAQWGWIGYLGSNDCQRWLAVADSDGWIKMRSVLTGGRVFDVSDCIGGSTQDIVVNTADSNTCQDFRFEPDGPVLLIDQNNARSVLNGPACPAYGATADANFPPHCRQWRFTSVGGAAYMITDTATGRLLGTSSCSGADGVATVSLLAPTRNDCRQAADWTLVPDNDSTWTLSLAGTPITEKVKLLIP